MIKKKHSSNISQGVSIVIILLVSTSSFLFGEHIQEEGRPVTSFCNSHYRNNTFMDTMIDSEPYQIREEYKNNASQEQINFTKQCGWMMPDWFILVFTVIFEFAIPTALALRLGSSLNEPERGKKRK